jgi:hypothetical protein
VSQAQRCVCGMTLIASAVALLLGALVQLPNLSTHREVEAEVEIQASPELVWMILTDFPAYPIWNPYIYPAKGEVRQGARLELTLHDGARSTTIQVTVLAVTANKELSWGGRLSGAFDRVQTFSLEPLGPDRVRLVSRAFFKGFLLPLVGGVPEGTRRGLAMMNSALRTRAELMELGAKPR